MSAAALAPLIELGLIGVATLDRDFIVRRAEGELVSWLRVGEVATHHSMALVGLEADLRALRERPGERLSLADISFGECEQELFYTVNVVWDADNGCYHVAVTRVSSQENYLVSATQLSRARHFFDEQLQVERQHFRQIYERTPQLAASYHQDTTVVAASDDLVERFLRETPLHTPASALPADNLLRAVIDNPVWEWVWAGQRVQNRAMRVNDRHGRPCDIEVSGVVARHSSSGNHSAHFSFVDVTARNQALQSLRDRSLELEAMTDRLRESNERFEKFATVAAHDLLSPLRRISKLSRIIGEEFENHGSEQLRTTLEELNKSAFQGRKLVNDVMELSRVAARTSQHESLAPAAVMRVVEDEYSFDLREIGAQLSYEGPDISVEADETLVVQIYRNLLSNAIKYRHPERPLRVVHRVLTGLDGGGVILQLSDNGRGFDSGRHDVFAAFVRLVGRHEVQGTGIGLAIVKEAAERLGWRVSADASEGDGATFSLALPVA